MEKIVLCKKPTDKMIDHYYNVGRITKYLIAVIKSKYEFDDIHTYVLAFYFEGDDDRIQLKVQKGLHKIKIEDNMVLGPNINWAYDIQKKYHETGELDELTDE